MADEKKSVNERYIEAAREKLLFGHHVDRDDLEDGDADKVQVGATGAYVPVWICVDAEAVADEGEPEEGG